MNATIAAILLAVARSWAVLRVQPSWQALLGRRWEWISAVLGLAIAGLASATGRVQPVETSSWIELGVLGVFELGLGTALGLIAALPGHALLGAVDSSASSLAGDRDVDSLAPLLVAVVLASGIALGLHHPLLGALLTAFDQWALARPDSWAPTDSLGPWLAERAASLTGLALALATPVLLTRVVIEIGVGGLARIGGDAASVVEIVTPALRFVAGLTALGAAYSAYPEAFAVGL